MERAGRRNHGALECGDLSPLLVPARLVGPGKAAFSGLKELHAPGRSTATSRLPKAVTSHRTPNLCRPWTGWRGGQPSW